MSDTITISSEEYNLLQKTIKQYKEWIDTYEALEIKDQEKQNQKLNELNSLADLI